MIPYLPIFPQLECVDEALMPSAFLQGTPFGSREFSLLRGRFPDIRSLIDQLRQQLRESYDTRLSDDLGGILGINGRTRS